MTRLECIYGSNGNPCINNGLQEVYDTLPIMGEISEESKRLAEEYRNMGMHIMLGINPTNNENEVICTGEQGCLGFSNILSKIMRRKP